MTKQITWHSKLCPCAFVMEFEHSPELPTDTRPYVPVARAHSEKRHFEAPGSDEIAELPAATCPAHDALPMEAAFVAVCQAHEAAGVKKNLRKVTVNTWRPDTCDCVIEYEFDSEEPGETRKHFMREPVSKCQHHQDVAKHGTKHAHFKGVRDENRKKNYAMGKLVESLPASAFVEEEDFDGNVIKRLKFEPRFSFDADRKLKLKVHAGMRQHVAKLDADVKKHFPDVDVE